MQSGRCVSFHLGRISALFPSPRRKAVNTIKQDSRREQAARCKPPQGGGIAEPRARAPARRPGLRHRTMAPRRACDNNARVDPLSHRVAVPSIRIADPGRRVACHGLRNPTPLGSSDTGRDELFRKALKVGGRRSLCARGRLHPIPIGTSGNAPIHLPARTSAARTPAMPMVAIV